MARHCDMIFCVALGTICGSGVSTESGSTDADGGYNIENHVLERQGTHMVHIHLWSTLVGQYIV